MKFLQKSAFLYAFLLIIAGIATNRCTTETEPQTAPLKNRQDASVFPHDIHAGKNGIDCKYCHNPGADGKTVSIPGKDICLKCHKQIHGSSPQEKGK